MKGKSSGDSKKTEKKKQEKVIEDRTFGLKNKNKSKTVQKYIIPPLNLINFGEKKNRRNRLFCFHRTRQIGCMSQKDF